MPRNHPEHFAALRREAVATPAARDAGVHTPELLAVDDSCELLPCPFAVYIRVQGQTLESLDLSPRAAREIWLELGRQLVPFMLEGYRELGQIDEDPDLEARIVWRHVQLGLVTLPRGPLPGRSWVERPLSLLVDTLAFFRGRAPIAWRPLAPPP